MSTIKEINSLKTLQEESDRDQTLSPVGPSEISSWNGQISYFASKIRGTSSISPKKLPSLHKIPVKITSVAKKIFLKRTPIYIINSPFKSYAKSLSPKKKFFQEPSSHNFAIQTFTPTPDLYKKVKDLLKGPAFPKRDLSPYRSQLCNALTSSNTIEELLHRTKISYQAIKPQKKRVSPFRECKFAYSLI